MTRLERVVVLALLVLVVLPDPAAAADPVSGAGAAPVGLDSLAAPVSGSGDYVFPSAREQWRTWALNAAGPSAIVGNLLGASWRQWVTEEPIEWEPDGAGFARRFGTGSLTTFIGETSLSLASAAMRQDAGYYRSPRRGFGPRLSHALAMTVVARDRDGDKVFSPGKALSPFVGPVATMTTLYPEGHTFVDGLVSGAYGLLINAGMNAAREFVFAAPPWHRERAATREPR